MGAETPNYIQVDQVEDIKTPLGEVQRDDTTKVSDNIDELLFLQKGNEELQGQADYFKSELERFTKTINEAISNKDMTDQEVAQMVAEVNKELDAFVTGELYAYIGGEFDGLLNSKLKYIVDPSLQEQEVQVADAGEAITEKSKPESEATEPENVGWLDGLRNKVNRDFDRRYGTDRNGGNWGDQEGAVVKKH